MRTPIIRKYPSLKRLFDCAYDHDPVSSRSLSQRVEYAIMKYRKNHRFTESKRGIFDQYLRFGGITTGPNAFLGRATSADAPDDPEVEQDWDAAKTAIDTVPEEQDEDLYVSFSEVAQVYLGNAFIRQSFFVAPQDFVDAPQLVDAFLRYLEIRNVCPEYKEDIAKAREIAAQAKVELPMCKHAARLLPGAFNEACSQLFGAKAAAVVLDSSWANMNMKARDMLDDFLGDVNVSTAKATRLVSPVIKEPKKRKVVEQREDILVKIVDISPFASDARDDQLVPVTLANFEDESEKFEILLEKHILASLLKGMVLLPTLHKLDSGQWYMDNNTKVYPTFYMVDECADPDQLFFE